MTNDPFSDPWGPTETTPVSNSPMSDVPVKEKIVSNEGKVVITLKQGTGYDAAWIVIHGTDAQDAANQLEQVSTIGLPARVAKAAVEFQATKGGTPAPRQGAPLAPPVQQSTPAPTSAPPGVEGRTCNHGEMAYRTGTNKFGKPYQAYFCAAPKGTPDQCRPIFL